MHDSPGPRLRPIVIRGARTHNLKGVDLTIAPRRLTVVTGVSGSGKSSLAFDTIYAEGQRRYVESLSAYARQFLERMERPDVDSVEGMPPAIAIRQKNSIRNPRSTVGTTTETHDYLRLLFARVGRTICRQCGSDVARETAEAVAEQLAQRPQGARLLVGFELPIVRVGRLSRAGRDESQATGDQGRDDDAPELDLLEPPPPADPVAAAIDTLRRKGFARLLVDGQATGFDEIDPATLADLSTLEVIVDRIKVDAEVRPRLTDAIEVAYLEGGGQAFAVELGAGDGGADLRHVFSERFECRRCAIVYEVPQPRLFSFNNPFGACPTCHGFGNVMELDMGLVVPDPSKTLTGGAIEPWTKPHYRAHLAAMKKAAKPADLRLDVPWSELTERERDVVLRGHGEFGGVQGFFQWLERKKYKVHIRVFLSRYRGYQTCPECGGTRLRREARDVRVAGWTIDRVCALTVREAKAFFATLELSPREATIAEKVLREIQRRLTFLDDVGLDYLSLDRLSSTLSGGEAQRISLATALGSALVGTLYVLDEPSIGLHPRDNLRLIAILRQLRDQGNTVIVVEHDADMIRVADAVVDMGLGAGESGGRVIYSGSVAGLIDEPRSLTAKYLRDDLAIAVPAVRRRASKAQLKVLNAREHNLKGVDVTIPLGLLAVVTGVSGSGKSTLVHDVVYAGIKRAKGDWDRRVGKCDRIEGIEHLSDVLLVDQTPIGRTPRSNPVTYLKAFDAIRDLFASSKDAKIRGLTPSHFSFNVPGGRCEACEGEGQVRVEMQFLADVFVPCDECHGKRFRPQVLEVRYKHKNIDDVLDLTVREAISFFAGSPKVLRRLHVLDEVGLGYLRLGQPATTLSGGEAQRIKIAAHLSVESGERMLYILDEPTTGLHFDDIAKLLAAFRRLLQAGHSLLVIEHNLDVIKCADWLIDLGPEGGDAGGRVVAVGTPEDIAAVEASHTGRHLAEVLRAANRAAVGEGA